MQYVRTRREKYIFRAIRFCIADFLKAEKQESQEVVAGLDLIRG